MKQKKKKHQRKSGNDVEENGASAQSAGVSGKKKRKHSEKGTHNNDVVEAVASPKKRRKIDEEAPNDDNTESLRNRRRRRREPEVDVEIEGNARSKPKDAYNDDDLRIVHVNKQKALEVIGLLQEQERRPKFGKNCRFLVPGKIAPKQPDGYEHIAWDSTTYIVQMARQCILKHDWRLLKDFIPLLMKYKHIKNYAKELAYLYFVVNAETEDDETLSEFRRLCFASAKEPDKRDGSVWYRV